MENPELPFTINELGPVSELFGQLFLLVFLVFLLIFVIYSAFLLYHWFSYGTSLRRSTSATIVYLGVSLPLVIVMAVSLTVII